MGKKMYVFLNRKQDLENQDRSGNEESGDISEEEEEEEVGDPSSERSSKLNVNNFSVEKIDILT